MQAQLKWLTAGVAAIWLAAQPGTGARAETLADALNGAYLNSGLLEQNRAVLRAADEGVAQAVSALRPVINWSASVSRDFGQRGTVTTPPGSAPGTSPTLVDRDFAVTEATLALLFRLTLYDGGANRLGVDAAKENVLATRSGLVSVEQRVLLRAVEAFMEVRRAVETVALRRNNLGLINEELRAARDRFEVGEVTRTDVALAEARLAGARSELAAAEGALTRAQAEYRAAVGRAPGALVTPRRLPALPARIDAATAQALRNHPDLQRAQRLVSAAELNILIAKASMSPTVDLNASVRMTEDLQTEDYSRAGSLSLDLSGPIYQGGRLSSLVRRSMASRDDARGNLHVVQKAIVQNVANAYAQLEVARASIVATQNQVRAAQVAFRGVREEATLGARTTLDVLDAEQELLDARTALISAQVDEYIAAYAVLASIGQLTVDALQLDVPRYDPAQYYNLVKDAPIPSSRQGQQLDRVLRALGKE